MQYLGTTHVLPRKGLEILKKREGIWILMGYFSNIQARQSSFYRRLWQELEGVKVYDTHEHLQPEEFLWRTPQGTELERLPVWRVFDSAYIHGPWQTAGGYAGWAEIINRQRGTGYLKSLLWAFEDLFDWNLQYRLG